MTTMSRKAMFGLVAAASIFTVAAVAEAAQPPQPGQPGQQGQRRAQGGPGGQQGPGQQDPAMRAQRLRQQLGITQDQEAAFQAWLQATQPPQPMDMQTMTTPQRVDRQVAEVTARAAAAKRFYNALTPQQRVIMDGLPPNVAMGNPGGGGRNGGPGGPGGPGGQGGRGQGRGPGGPGGANGFGPPQGFNGGQQ